MRSDRRENLVWVLREIQRLPGATIGHLKQLPRGRPADLHGMVNVAHNGNGGCPWVVEVTEPGARGWVLTRHGKRALVALEQGRPLPSPKDGGAEPLLQMASDARPHHRLVVDLAVELETLGTVVTEYESGTAAWDRNRPDGRKVSQREQEGTHRPDLLLDLGDARWAVEVERSAKWRGEDGRSRYSRIIELISTGVTFARTPIAVSGAWYLVQSTAKDASVVRELMGGLFEALDDATTDVLVVVQPCDLNTISTQPYRKRAIPIGRLVSEAAPLLQDLPARPASQFQPGAMGYLTTAERAPSRLAGLSVALTGRMTPSGAELLCHGRSYRLVGMPNDLAHPIHPGDRLIVVGTVDDGGRLKVERCRGAGSALRDSDDSDTIDDWKEELF